MELKPGYKKTEAGVIPMDWDVIPLGNLLANAPTYGINAPAIPYDSRYPTYLRITDISDDGKFVEESKASVQHFLAPNYILYEGDLVFARTGASVGKSYLYNYEDGELVFAGFLIRIRPDVKKLMPSYLKYFTQSAPYWNWVKVNSMRSGQPGINGHEYASLPTPIPPTKAEQEAIAEALSDADALIESLEQLIAKKRQVKQGAMQELLTGKKRLLGFNGEWEVKWLSDICWYQEGPGVRNSQFTTTGVKLLNGTNIYRGKLNLDTTTRSISHDQAYGPYAHFLAESNDIVIASSGISIGRFHEKVAYVRGYDLPFCMNTSTIRFKPKRDTLNCDYFFQYLCSNDFKKAIGGQATGSAQLNFGPSHLGRVMISIPDLSEQTTIATILSDMDAEITALETKLAKARQVKQGMMQELLTGRIRLI